VQGGRAELNAGLVAAGWALAYDEDADMTALETQPGAQRAALGRRLHPARGVAPPQLSRTAPRSTTLCSCREQPRDVAKPASALLSCAAP
jgi:hypothetical protein